MCHLCELYGDPTAGGGVWYLNPKNYARQMYRRRPPGYVPSGAETGPEAGVGLGGLRTVQIMEQGPEAWAEYQKAIAERARRGGGSQGGPIRDAAKKMEIPSPIG